MPTKKQRTEIAPEVAAEVLFASNRTCCVCRTPRKAVQLHHIDENPNVSIEENLAVLCFDCHRETQIKGGFDRKLDAAQVLKFKADWLTRVAGKRTIEHGPLSPSRSRGFTLRYVQWREESDEFGYSIDADYILIDTGDANADFETNSSLTSFAVDLWRGFRLDAISTKPNKDERRASGEMCMDGLSISPEISMSTPMILSIAYVVDSWHVGAAHPNHHTKTISMRLSPSYELRLANLFSEQSRYLEAISAYCIKDLHRQQLTRWADSEARASSLTDLKDQWILQGAEPKPSSFRAFTLRPNGINIHFDAYQVGSYAEGKYEVLVPYHEIGELLNPDFASLVGRR